MTLRTASGAGHRPPPGDGPEPGDSRRSRALDTVLVLLAVVLVPTGAAFVEANYRSDVPSIVFGLFQGSPLLFCRRRALLAWAVFLAGMALFSGLADPLRSSTPYPWPSTAMIGYVVVQFAVAVRHRRLVALGTWVAAVLAVGVVWQARNGAGGTSDIPLLTAISGVALVAGDNVRGRREAKARLRTEVRRSEELHARRTLLEERTRIARELHDIVAHHMSVIAVQASTAAYRSPGLSPAAAAEFGSIADSARASLTDLRRLLAVLRSEDESAARTPQPGLGDLDELIHSTRRAGAPRSTSTGSPFRRRSRPRSA